MYGTSQYRPASASFNMNYQYGNVQSGEDVLGVPNVTENGDVYVTCNASRATLTDGFYLVVLSVAEV